MNYCRLKNLKNFSIWMRKILPVNEEWKNENFCFCFNKSKNGKYKLKLSNKS